MLVALVLDVSEPDLTPVENLLTPTMLDLAQAALRPKVGVRKGSENWTFTTLSMNAYAQKRAAWSERKSPVLRGLREALWRLPPRSGSCS